MLYVQNKFFKMDSFEINKIIAAVLMVTSCYWYRKTIKYNLSREKPKTPAYIVK